MFRQVQPIPRKAPPPSSEGFRPDIEGMRAVAILAVLLCHSGVAVAAGGYVGVDVFFVISGFLITRLLINEVQGSGSISMSRFYARRAKRILPLSAVLLVFVAILSLTLLSPLRSVEVSGDIKSSALYVANWRFAAQSVNYFQLGIEPSPLLHLWSLGIEEQFYLAWPTLVLAVAWLGRRTAGVRPALGVALVAIFAGSLALGIAQTGADPAWAYFSTFDRAWELALGGALALLGPVRMPRPVAQALAWAGVGAIAYAILVFDARTPFPGAAALAPTLGAAVLVLAGPTLLERRGPSPASALSLAPVRYVGRISYAWYLWHWPFLVFAAAIFGPLSVPAALLVLVVSAVPTVASHHLIEEPARRAKGLVLVPARGLALGACCMGTAVVAGAMLLHLQPTLPTLPAAEAKGAAALQREPDPEQRAGAIRPTPIHARADLPGPIREGCMLGIAGTRSGPCVYGDPRGQRTLILFGDSHAMQDFPALQVVAKRNGWRLVVLTKRECSPAEAPIRNIAEGREYSQCDAWRRASLARIEAEGRNGPTSVALSGDSAETAYGPGGEALSSAAGAQAMQSGYAATLRRLRGAGLAAVVIRDTPEAPTDVPSCVSEHLHSFQACAFPRPRDRDRNYDLRAARSAQVPLIDVTPEICPRALCRAVIGNVLVFRDTAHLTATYARSLAPWFEPGLKRSIMR